MKGRVRDDRGATELFVLAMVPAVLFALGLVVDLGGRDRARDRAAWCAQQASRAGAAQMDVPAAQGGALPPVALSAGAAEAQRAVAASEMTGTVQVVGATVTVTCTAQYRPLLLATGTWSVDATESARAARGITEER